MADSCLHFVGVLAPLGPSDMSWSGIEIFIGYTNKCALANNLFLMAEKTSHHTTL
jgi:hypothetical protein